MTSEWMPAWGIYWDDAAEYPETVLVDIALHDVLDDIQQEIPWLMLIRLKFRDREEHGLGSAEERDRLNTLTDRMGRELAEEGMVFAGRRLGNGELRAYIYGPHPETLEEAVKAYRGDMEEYSPEIQYHQDPSWEYYRTELFPSELHLKLIYTDMTVDAMEQEGVDTEEPRMVAHYLYFPDEAALKSASERAADFGYLAQPVEPVDGEEFSEEYPLGLAVYHHVAISGINLHDHIQWLFALAEESGGVYDGWTAGEQ